jgi:tRNA(Ile)-lysidine synthase
MPFTSEQLKDRLARLAADRAPSRYVLAYSGGLDSTVLLHALNDLTQGTEVPVLALHVQHDLHADAGTWEEHCRATAGAMALDYESINVVVDRDSGLGLEAAARQARYAALQQHMQAGDWLLSAHHQDDQAETLLLNLLRGSGMAGMAGIGTLQVLGTGYLVRPLLEVSRADLKSYASLHNLTWLDDPANSDAAFDRNYLRHTILPALVERWPAAASRLARSSALAGEASEMLEQLADEDLGALGQPQRLESAALAKLSDARQRNVLRRALKLSNLNAAPSTRLRQIIDELVPARADAEPLVRWPGVEIRRYREFIYLLPELPGSLLSIDNRLGPGNSPVDLGSLGKLRLQRSGTGGLCANVIDNGLEIRFRAGGEAFQPQGHECTHKLKKLLQQEGIVPWMRDKLPLLYAGERLVAVADLWVAADAADNNGFSVEWDGHPSVY